MIVRVERGTEYYPKYVGWYITTSETTARAWEAGKKPDHDALLSQATHGGSLGAIKYLSVLWAYRPVPPENEFGPVTP